MMEVNNGQGNGKSDGDEPILNPHACVTPTLENPCVYPPFDMCLVPNYTNNQITYYYTTGAIPTADQPRFHQLMKQRKTSLNLIGWDSESDDSNNRNSERNNDTLMADNSNPSSDLDCPVPLPNFKGIKISPLDIPKLWYNSTVTQYNNWLVDLKTAFDGDSAKFPTSHQKIILALITLDEQLKTTYNSATQASPILSRHWRKFERWPYAGWAGSCRKLDCKRGIRRCREGRRPRCGRVLVAPKNRRSATIPSVA